MAKEKKAKTKAAELLTGKKTKKEKTEAAKAPKADKKIKAPKAPKADKAAKGKKAKSKEEDPLKPTFDAPAEFKPFHMKVTLTTSKDGMLDGNVQCFRYIGKIEEDKAPNKVFDMSQYDEFTVRGVAARIAMVLFHATGRVNSKGISPRLPANTTYELHCRVGASKEAKLSARINKVFTTKITPKGRTKQVELDKKDLIVRKFRKANRYLAAAFVQAQNPPKRERASRRAQADEE